MTDRETIKLDMDEIAMLDIKQNRFFDHHDAEVTKMFMNRR